MVSLPFDKRSNHSLHGKSTLKMDKTKKIEDFLSNSRFQPYLDYCEKNDEKALTLYQMNLRLNGAFFPILSMLEVALRNSIDKKMTISYPLHSEDNWISQLEYDINLRIEEKKLNKSDFSNLICQLGKSKKSVNTKIEQNIKNFLKRKYRNDKNFKKQPYESQEIQINKEFEYIKLNKGLHIKKDVMITNMDFSFWTGIFDVKPYGFIESISQSMRLLEIFNFNLMDNEVEKNRSLISEKLHDIRQFRNRVAHNEPLIFVKQKFDSKFPKKIRNDIMFLLKSLNQDLEVYSEDIYAINTHLIKIEDYCESIEMIISKEN